MKKKTLSILLSGLLAVSLTGVGFASWLISANSDTSVTGDIAVETVGDERVSLTANMTDANVNFGALTTPATTHTWLINDGAGEDMKFSFNLKASNTEKLSSLTIEFLIHEEYDDQGNKTTDNAATFNAASNYIVAPDLDSETEGNQTSISFDKTTVDGWGADGENFEFEFTWGSAFNFTNPYQYYNNQAYTTTLASEASEALGAMEALNNLKFDIKITASIA